MANHNKETILLDQLRTKSPTSPSNCKNFSSRNSLRSAQRSRGTMLPADSDNWRQIGNYIAFDDELFLKNIGGFLYCALCGKRQRFLGDETIDDHLRSQGHSANLNDLRSLLVDQVPETNSLQMSCVREYLNKWFNTFVLPNEAYYQRLDIVEEFRYFVSLVNPACSCRVTGSLATGTMLVTSDINLELIHPNSKLFESDPRAKNSIHHKLVDPDADYGDQFNLHSLHYDLAPNAYETLYKIGTALCQGTYTPHSDPFQLMSSLNDLNRKVPKLILQHKMTKTRLEIFCYAGSNHRLTNLLTLYMGLDERARRLSLLVKHWAKICNIDRPDRGTYSPETFVILVIYHLQRTSPPVLPCLHEIWQATTDAKPTAQKIDNSELTDISQNEMASQEEITLADDEFDNEEEDEGQVFPEDCDINDIDWQTQNYEDIGNLFIGFLKSMSDEFSTIKNVITIRTLKEVTPKEKNWNTNIKGIEHPIKPRVNISRGVGCQRTYSYIRNCFRCGFYYLTSVPVSSTLAANTTHQEDPRDYINLYIDQSRLDFYFEMVEKTLRKGKRTLEELISQRVFSRDVEAIDLLMNTLPNHSQLPSVVANMYREELLKPKDVDATKYCCFCRKNGHVRDNCPKVYRRALSIEFDTDYSSLDARANLDSRLLMLYNSDRILPRLSQTHSILVEDLKDLINKETGLNCELELYGSTVNLLGSPDSDLDICMILDGDKTGKGVDFADVLSQVQIALLSDARVKSMEAILSARVPILKFKYTTEFRTFEVDLSMYNQCAIYNSQLLKAYVEIDVRFSQLFYLVKRMAKACGIADATKGSLSSYAWALLVVHYLQRVDPPILPVLQEVPRGVAKPTFGVNGWNVWFNTDKVKMQPLNDSQLTQLFRGFMLFYSNFKFDTDVVTIRTRKILTRFQKNWNDCVMAIEDPFELTYNLASRLDEQMGVYIINFFPQAFRHLVKIQTDIANKHLTAYNRLFYADQITDSTPPYRGCRICHRIGHKLNDCPSKRLVDKNRSRDRN